MNLCEAEDYDVIQKVISLLEELTSYEYASEWKMMCRRVVVRGVSVSLLNIIIIIARSGFAGHDPHVVNPAAGFESGKVEMDIFSAL